MTDREQTTINRQAALVESLADRVKRQAELLSRCAEKITGFRGYRYRWWDRSIEVPLDLPTTEARRA